MVALIPIGAAAACPPFEEAKTDKQMIASAVCLIKDGARDPDSVKFRDVYVSTLTYVTGPRTGTVLKGVCGEMTGKNGYGGMTGWKGFTYVMDTQRFWGADNCAWDRDHKK